MKIGIFVAMAGRKAGGPETYECELVRSLASIDKVNEYHIFCFNRAAQESFHLSQENFKFHTMWPPIRSVSMLTSLTFKLLKYKTDVLHATYVPPALAVRDYVYSLLCFSMFQHPEFYPPAVRWRIQKLTAHGIKKSRLTLCISQNIRDLTAEKFGVSADRLGVVYLGVSDIFRPLPEKEKRRLLRESYGINDPYILFSGRWEARKNITGTLEAFARFKRERKSETKLVLEGRRTWSAQQAQELIDRLGLQNDIIEIGRVKREEMPLLYGGAEALVYASLWEGFGLPIVEAMACGTPVITSNISSMPEVAGDAGLLVDPYSVKDLAAAMDAIISDGTVRESLRMKGLERAKIFTWKRTAQQTLAAYEQMVASA
jgi:glycosyltransferase involved in cell wall biosynthesis